MGLIDSFLNKKDLPPEKKKVLAIGGIAFIVLLFVSFLLSLTEDTKDNNEAVVADSSNISNTGTLPNNQTQGSLQLPSSQRYDFAQDINSQANTQGQGLESLLNSGTNQNIGIDEDPFANFNQGTNNNNSASTPSTPNTATATPPSSKEELGPAPIPTETTDPKTNKAMLFCDEFANASDAERQKAMLAFQGISAQVVHDKGKYRLRLGPYESSEKARNVFSDLGNRGLVFRCSLVKE